MASVMGICGGLVGPKSESVEKQPVFACFFEGPRLSQADSENEQVSGLGRFEVEKVRFSM